MVNKTLVMSSDGVATLKEYFGAENTPMGRIAAIALLDKFKANVMETSKVSEQEAIEMIQNVRYKDVDFEGGTIIVRNDPIINEWVREVNTVLENFSNNI